MENIVSGQKKEKKSVKCPVCGRFVSEEKVSKYEYAHVDVAEYVKLQQDCAKIIDERDSLKESNDIYRERNASLSMSLVKAEAEIERLRNRSFLERVFNK
jgi:uncharacterized Zn finger protein (UPF0148 family)